MGIRRRRQLRNRASKSSAHGNRAPSADAVSGSTDPPTIYLDANGDLRLRATTETAGYTQDFVVCSRALTRLSPVWGAMLSSGFQESRPAEGEWIVSLPDDDP